MTDPIKELLEKIIDYVSEPDNADARYLQLLAAKALLKYNEKSISVQAAGKAGNKARNQNLTAEQRSDIAQKAAQSRWANGGFARSEALTPERRSKIAQQAAKARWHKK